MKKKQDRMTTGTGKSEY